MEFRRQICKFLNRLSRAKDVIATSAFTSLMMRLAVARRAVSASGMAVVAVGVLMLGILLPIGLSAWEAYTPTDATLVVIWND